jgi:hypothetical protein
VSEVLKREQWPIYLDCFNKLNEGRLKQVKVFDFIPLEHLPGMWGVTNRIDVHSRVEPERVKF